MCEWKETTYTSSHTEPKNVGNVRRYTQLAYNFLKASSPFPSLITYLYT